MTNDAEVKLELELDSDLSEVASSAPRDSSARSNEPRLPEALLPLIYDELRALAARRLALEAPGQTLQPTALVHEAYLRLTQREGARSWDGRRHFFAAAAEAMRRILIENARRKRSDKHGGGRRRDDVMVADVASWTESDDLLDLDDAIAILAKDDPEAAELVRLRVFAGLSVEEAGDVLEISRAAAYRHWVYARAWLHARLGRGVSDEDRGDSSNRA